LIYYRLIQMKHIWVSSSLHIALACQLGKFQLWAFCSFLTTV